MHFNINEDFRRLRLWFTDGQIVEILDDSETWKERGDALVLLQNLFTNRAPAEWHELVCDIRRSGTAVQYWLKVP